MSADEFGVWFFNLYDTDVEEPVLDGCAALLVDAPNFRGRARDRHACPCTGDQAEFDRRWHSIESEIDNDLNIYYESRRTYPLVGVTFGEQPIRVKKVAFYTI